MGSGAFAVIIDQQAGGGPAGALKRVVPLPPPGLSGGVKFTTVVLSLALRQLWRSWRARDNPYHGTGATRHWDSRHDQRNYPSWTQMVSLFACG